MSVIYRIADFAAGDFAGHHEYVEGIDDRAFGQELFRMFPIAHSRANLFEK